ncbi:hypothetical protein F52700_7597 [Fusarium sp. NRRL 52700]|nr:hypothetical protein F52700_7597 [Fusarium sp. NRRL 52700]
MTEYCRTHPEFELVYNCNDSAADYHAHLIEEDDDFCCEDPRGSGVGGRDPDEGFFSPELYISLTTTIDKSAFKAFSEMDLRKHGPETGDPAINRLWRSQKNGKHAVLLIP